MTLTNNPLTINPLTINPFYSISENKRGHTSWAPRDTWSNAGAQTGGLVADSLLPITVQLLGMTVPLLVPPALAQNAVADRFSNVSCTSRSRIPLHGLLGLQLNVTATGVDDVPLMLRYVIILEKNGYHSRTLVIRAIFLIDDDRVTDIPHYHISKLYVSCKSITWSRPCLYAHPILSSGENNPCYRHILDTAFNETVA
ncbi:unnamed protein product [Camellia sinensis]